jgi:hypothetical protein
MTGYRRARKVYRLIFADPDMEGLEVRAKSSTMGEYLAITRLLFQLRRNVRVVEEDLDVMDDLFGRFAKVLTSWNLEDDESRPVPATKEALLDQEFDFVMAIIDAWIDAVNGVDPDLGKDSTSGEHSPEVDIPMELLSASPLS